MPSIQEIKRRAAAVKSTSQITRAMEMVAATKMRKSQVAALLSRAYTVETLRILSFLRDKANYLPEIMTSREIKKTAIVLIASDRGFAGSFNNNTFRAFEKTFEKVDDENKYFFISVGKKAEEYLLKKKIKINQAFKNFGDYVEVEQTSPLAGFLIQNYLERKIDEVLIISTHFRSTLKQEVMVKKILPIDQEKIWQLIKELVPETGRFANVSDFLTEADQRKYSKDFEYLIEPDAKTVLDNLAPRLIEIAIYDLILEANASEHSARMVAMKNASENAEELKQKLNIAYNKLRQSLITREISEIVAGAEALK
jgi:F-type H+-transporting ATPase subunit gamma